MTRVWQDERGAALALAILGIALLSLGAVVGLSRLSAERRTNGNFEAEVDAFALAQAGMDRYFAAVSSAPGASFDTTITGLPGGSVAVAVRRLRAAAANLPAVYVVRAYATNTRGPRFGADIPASERTVARFATWESKMDVRAAWTSITGIRKDGGSGIIDGGDQCGAHPAVAGVAVPDLAVDGNTGYNQTGGVSVPNGTPPISYEAPTASTFAPLVGIDWDAIVNGGALPVDYKLTGTSSWPSSFVDWPIIFVNSSSVSLGSPHSGQGLLVVTGDIIMNGTFSWRGVILAGGAVTSNGNQTLEGALVSGLNVQLGQAVGVSDVANGTKTIRYDSCYVTSALSGLAELVPMSNAWVDNWPSW